MQCNKVPFHHRDVYIHIYKSHINADTIHTVRINRNKWNEFVLFFFRKKHNANNQEKNVLFIFTKVILIQTTLFFKYIS